jgi:hypothetical protein
MNKLSTLTAATALVLAGPALAYTGVSPTLVESVEGIVAESGIGGVDLTQLTDEQIVEIYMIGQSSDAGEQNTRVRGILEGTGAIMEVSQRRVVLVETDMETGLEPVGENSVVRSVQNVLDREGFEVDASTLSDAQVAEIYFAAFSSDMADGTTKNEISTILGM